MTRYPYSYDRWSAASSPEPYSSTPASPSLDSHKPATYYPSRPRPAEVEDFEGSDAEFAPRVVQPAFKPTKVQANKANEAKKVQPPPMITGIGSADAPPVFDPSPSSPSVYSAHSGYSAGSSHQRGRPAQRNSFYSINYMSDRGSTADRATTPVEPSEPLRGILKNGKDKDDNPLPERQPSRSGGRVRYPAQQTEQPHTQRQPMSFGDPPGPGSLVHEDSMDSNGTTRAECNYTGYKSRRDPSPVHDINDPRDSYERRTHPGYYEYGRSMHVPSSSPRPARSEHVRQSELINRPAPPPTSAPASAHLADEENYTYYQPNPFQRQPEYDPQYDPYRPGQYKPYDQYERYSGYEQYNQYNQSPQYTQYAPMDYRAGPPLAPQQSPIFLAVRPVPVPAPVPVHPVRPMYMEQPRPRSSSGTCLSPADCYNTRPPPYYGPSSPGSGYPPPSFF